MGSKIILTGASGLVGEALVAALLDEGYEVFALARTPKRIASLPASHVFEWTHDQPIPLHAFRNVDAVIHLAGEGVAAKRWTKQRKQQLWDSRCHGTQNLVAGLAALPESDRPHCFVSASAVGFYGASGEGSVDEASPAGHGFLSDLCVEWERQARVAETIGLRTVIARFGVILARQGGALAKMGPVILGDGRQWMSWVHIDDVVQFALRALSDRQFDGIYNLTAPQPVRQREFVETLVKVRRYPVRAKIPAFALRLLLGEMSTMLLDGQRVLPSRTVSSGFSFQYQELVQALKDLS